MRLVVKRCVGISVHTPRSRLRSYGFSGDRPRSTSPMSRAQVHELWNCRPLRHAALDFCG